MKVWSSVITLCVVAALVVGDEPKRAYACTCVPMPSTESDARRYMENIDGKFTLVVGVVQRQLPDAAEARAVVQPSRVYAGRASASYDVTSGDCNGIGVDLSPGRQVLLLLREDQGRFQALPCASTPLDGRSGAAAFVQILDRMFPAAASVSPATGRSGPDSGWIALGVFIAAAAIGLGALVTLARRRGRDNDEADCA